MEENEKNRRYNKYSKLFDASFGILLLGLFIEVIKFIISIIEKL